MNKKCKKVCNKNTRKVSSKVRSDECPNNVCPIDKKKKTKKAVSRSKSPEVSQNLFGRFLNFVFPSRLK